MKNALYILFLGILLATLSCASEAGNTAEVEALKQQIAETEAKIQAMEKDQTGLIHSVFFWLKEDISPEEKAQFEAGVKSLSAISHVKSFYMGPPAGTEERGVVDKSYSMALICHFEDIAGQDAYQIDPIHLKFVEENKEAWTKVVVYDNIVQ